MKNSLWDIKVLEVEETPLSSGHTNEKRKCVMLIL